MAVSTYVSVTILIVNGLNAPVKKTEWQNGHKYKSYIYAAWKRLTSHLKTHTDWKWGNWNKVFYANGNQKKVRVAILLSDKINFKTKTVKRNNKGHYIHNDQGINPRRCCDNCKYTCTQ